MYTTLTAARHPQLRCQLVCKRQPLHSVTVNRIPALMIHGGSHMIFSRKDIRPAQTRLLLSKGLLPVSPGYRLCPEVALAKGVMEDVCDALEWARIKLPALSRRLANVEVDGSKLVVVGWSSGGQLAMSLAWTAPLRGLAPPTAILAFYAPTDYEDTWWTQPIQPVGAEFKGQVYDVLEGVQDKPVSNYDIVGAWEEPITDPRTIKDPRTRLILHINWKAQTLPVILNGFPSKDRAAADFPQVKDWESLPQPTVETIRAASPQGTYQQRHLYYAYLFRPRYRG